MHEMQNLMLKLSVKSASITIILPISFLCIYQGIFLSGFQKRDKNPVRITSLYSNLSEGN